MAGALPSTRPISLIKTETLLASRFWLERLRPPVADKIKRQRLVHRFFGDRNRIRRNLNDFAFEFWQNDASFILRSMAIGSHPDIFFVIQRWNSELVVLRFSVNVKGGRSGHGGPHALLFHINLWD